jgi:hypothetical protein
MRVGFWCGLISGLIAFPVRAAIGYLDAFNPGRPNADIPPTPFYTVAEYQHLNIFDGLGSALVPLHRKL